MKFNCKFALVAATVLTVAPILSFPNIMTTVQATTKKAQAAKNTIQVNKAPIIYDRAGNYNSKYHQNIKAGTRLKYSGKTYIIQQRFAAGIPVPTSRIIGGKLYYSIGKGGYVKESDVLTWLGNTNTVKLHFRHKKNYIYDKNGRVTIANKSGAKILISLHLNSNDIDLVHGGVEVYLAPNMDNSLAKLFASNIVENANTTYSKMESFKEENGVYVRTIDIGNRTYGTFKGYKGIYDEAAYLFIIRETGGIATGAYVNGNDSNYGENIYRNSNVGIEGYLIELGYMNVNRDLRNILNNRDLYIQAITDTINSFYKIKE